jgi:hypothetical protein
MRRLNDEMTQALAAAAPEWVIAGDFRISATSPVRGSQDRLLSAGSRSATPTHQSGNSLRITATEARELVEEIMALRDRWIARSQDESDLTSYRLNIALAPVLD